MHFCALSHRVLWGLLAAPLARNAENTAGFLSVRRVLAIRFSAKSRPRSERGRPMSTLEWRSSRRGGKAHRGGTHAHGSRHGDPVNTSWLVVPLARARAWPERPFNHFITPDMRTLLQLFASFAQSSQPPAATIQYSDPIEPPRLPDFARNICRRLAADPRTAADIL